MPAVWHQRLGLKGLAPTPDLYPHKSGRHSAGTYTHPLTRSQGRPYMTEELRVTVLSVGHRRVGRLIQENDSCVVRTRRFKVKTNGARSHAIAPNLLGQDFSAPALNQKCATDITYI